MAQFSLFIAGSVLLIIAAVADCHGEFTADNPLEVEQHTVLRLVCQIPAGVVQFAWWRAEEELHEGERVKLEESQGDHGDEFVLTIAEAEETDAGVYTCRDHVGHTLTSIAVMIVPNNPLTTTTNRKEVDVGGELELHCQADVHSDIAWFYDDRQFSDDDSDAALTVNEDERTHLKTLTLVRHGVTQNDQGTYICRNLHHEEDRSQVLVTIKPRSAGHGQQPKFLLIATSLFMAVAASLA